MRPWPLATVTAAAALLVAVLLAAPSSPAATLAGTAAEPRDEPGPPPEAPPAEGGHDATLHHRFTDIDRWVKIFDSPERDAWQKPDELTSALKISPGMVVADLGSGTGYLLSYLSRAVGAGGVVLAIDTEPEMVEHIGRRVRDNGVANIVPVLAQPDDPFLPRGRIDRVVIVDTYHHIDDRLEYFARLRDSLTPGGLVAIIDFRKKPLPVGPPLEHKLAREFVVGEMQRAGWRLSGEEEFLPYQYFLLFAPAPH